ncbi:fumarylacetoacetate hydrolase family protein [Mesorhizobium sp. M7A.F.Ca.US.006.01.1.1]|uniref:fumarylacetoacetate hydrolase family protein n=1 Tax=Mesorhizobium sp. M7A.F.Ca.US.006.01.1.1 TaxID=2496707 RepID=UPI001FE04B7F|nr:fumarylacetoacetate hydrolase family protein [Mesorhizobium sp. M7A.F.Ca.US.006.01.1.1]
MATADGVFRGLDTSSPTYPGNLDTLLPSRELVLAAEALMQGPVVEEAEITFLTPLKGTGKILCVGLNYRDHASESGMPVPEFPTVFARFSSGLVPHGQPLTCPSVSSQFDYEGELAAVIGKAGRNIAPSDALDHVAGYSIFNDGSVRDYQLRTSQWTIGKNFDGTGGFGPYFVTADELAPAATGLRIEPRLNGTVMQSAKTDDLIFDVPRLVSLISVAMTLEVGDIIVTGTPSGVGAARKPPVFMRAGDVCEVEIERLGTLLNPIR